MSKKVPLLQSLFRACMVPHCIAELLKLTCEVLADGLQSVGKLYGAGPCFHLLLQASNREPVETAENKDTTSLSPSVAAVYIGATLRLEPPIGLELPANGAISRRGDMSYQ